MDTALVITILVLSILAMAKLIRLNRKKETLNSSRRHIARHHAPVHIPDSHSPDVIDVGGGFVLVKGSYLNKFLKGGILDDDLYISMDEYGYNRPLIYTDRRQVFLL